ncbi:MAG: hypothetical protein ABI852_16165 [Gemmatimonadaceae bacterium]
MRLLQKLGQKIVDDPIRTTMRVFGFIFLWPYGYVAARILGVPRDFEGLFAIPFASSAVLLANYTLPAVWKAINSSIKMTWFFTHYAADRTIPVSHVEAMISAGDYDEAAAEIDALLAKHGVDPVICKLAIDHHLGRFGSRERGEALLRRMRNENPARYEGMATQRLIDLYMTQTETHGKALTELRRLASRFPGTREAEGALACILQLRLKHDEETTGHVWRAGAETS